jgi:hypothetical protein
MRAEGPDQGRLGVEDARCPMVVLICLRLDEPDLKGAQAE